MTNQEKQHVYKNATATLNQKDLFNSGFTRKLIKILLPQPQLVQNPYFKDGASIQLWQKSDVDAAMETDQFQEAEPRPSYRYGIPLSEVNQFLYGRRR